MRITVNGQEYESCSQIESTHFFHTRTGLLLTSNALRNSQLADDCVLPVRPVVDPEDDEMCISGRCYSCGATDAFSHTIGCYA